MQFLFNTKILLYSKIISTMKNLLLSMAMMLAMIIGTDSSVFAQDVKTTQTELPAVTKAKAKLAKAQLAATKAQEKAQKTHDAISKAEDNVKSAQDKLSAAQNNAEKASDNAKKAEDKVKAAQAELDKLTNPVQ